MKNIAPMFALSILYMQVVFSPQVLGFTPMSFGFLKGLTTLYDIKKTKNIKVDMILPKQNKKKKRKYCSKSN